VHFPTILFLLTRWWKFAENGPAYSVSWVPGLQKKFVHNWVIWLPCFLCRLWPDDDLVFIPSQLKNHLLFPRVSKIVALQNTNCTSVQMLFMHVEQSDCRPSFADYDPYWGLRLHPRHTSKKSISSLYNPDVELMISIHDQHSMQVRSVPMLSYACALCHGYSAYPSIVATQRHRCFISQVLSFPNRRQGWRWLNILNILSAWTFENPEQTICLNNIRDLVTLSSRPSCSIKSLRCERTGQRVENSVFPRSRSVWCGSRPRSRSIPLQVNTACIPANQSGVGKINRLHRSRLVRDDPQV
jgi:hypothetical protein